MNFMNDIFLPAFSDIPTTMTFADAPYLASLIAITASDKNNIYQNINEYEDK